MLSRIRIQRHKALAIVAALAVLLTTLTLAVGPNNAQAQAIDVGGIPDPSACYGVADQASGINDGLSVISRLDGVTSNVGLTGTTDIEAVAFGPGSIIDPALAQQVLYTFDGVDFGYINLSTGAFTSLGLPDPAGFTTVDGMTWDPQLNVFWVTDRLSGDGVADRVAAYDPTTGTTTVGPFSTGIATEPGWTNAAGLAYDDFDDIALDPTDFKLYAILNKGGSGGGLVELSKTDGTIINYVGLFTPANAASDFDGDGITDDVEGLAFFNDGNLYGSTGANGPGADTNRFFSIDVATGTTTWIANFTDYLDYEALGCLTVEAFIDVEKGTSEPGGIPEDADLGPGPTITTPTVEWTYVITNESLSLDVNNVVLVDDQIAGVLFNQATGETQCAEGVILAPGEILAPQDSVTCTVTGTTITGPYTNNATLTALADPGNGLPLLDLVDQDPSNYVGDPFIPDPPVLAVVKTAVAGAGVDCSGVPTVAGDGPLVSVPLGDTVTFCVTVTNTGGSDATNVTVTDNNATPGDPADDFVVTGLDNIDLAVGESATGSFEVPVTSLTPALNTVTATGTDPNTGDATNEPADTAQVVALGAPALEVVKTVVAGDIDCAGVTPAPGNDDITVEIGDTVTFCVTVTNVGTSQATEVTVTDDNLTPADPADDFVIAGLDNITLAAGESATGSFTTIASGGGQNTVTATGTDPNTGEPTNEPTDPSEVLIFGPPVLEVVKTVVAGDSDCTGVTPAPGPDALTVELGDTVTFCVTVTNVGDTEATQVTVTDDNLTPADPADDIVIAGLDNITLAAGESATGALTIAAPNAGLNTVTATGTDPNTGEPTNEPTDPAVLTILGAPILQVVKTVVAGDSDCAGVTPAPGPDDITIEIGDTVTFCVTVTNVGDTEATQVTVTDDNLTPADPADDIVIAGLDNITLAAGESATGALTITVTDAGVNTVTATGTDPNTGEPTNEPTDPSEVFVLGPPILQVVKTAVAGADIDCAGVTPAPGLDDIPTTVGADVTFCVTVTNVGQTEATNVTVTDDNFTPEDLTDDVVVPGLDNITLAAGESATGSFTHTVDSQAELQNTVTATGIDPNTGNPTNEPTDTAGINPPQGNAQLVVVKTAVVGDNVDCSTVTPAPGGDAQPVEIGDSVTFCITVANVGEGPASNVVVIDDNFTPDDAADDVAVDGLNGIDLEPGASATGSIVFEVTELGSMINTVTATGIDDNSGEPTNEPTDPSGVVPFGTPILTVTKTAVKGADVDCATVDPATGLDEVPVAVGDVVTYCIIVTNTGDGLATDVAAIDDNFTPDDDTDDVVVAEAATLAPDATLIGSFTRTVTEDQAPQNTAKATGTDPVTGTPTNEPTDPAGVLTPDIDLVKQILRGPDQPGEDAAEGINELVIGETGDEVTWVYTVTNTGTIPLIVEEIVDPSLGITVPIPGPDQLILPGESVTVTTNGVITDTGALSEATVQGQPADDAGEPLTDFEALTAANDAAEGPAEITLTKQILRGSNRDCADATEGVNEVVIAEPGDPITWCFVITNTGLSPLANVLFTDQDLNQVEINLLTETGTLALEPGETIRRSANDTVPSGGLINVASVAAVPSDPNGNTGGPAFEGAPTVEGTNDAENNSIEIKLEKRVLLGFNADCSLAVEGRDEGVTGRIGDDVTWCFTAINTGSVALRVTEIVDVTLDVVIPVPEDQQILVVSDPFASVTVQLNGTIDSETTENTASVDGTAVDPETGEPVIDPETSEPIPPIQDTNTALESPTMSDLRLVKSKTLPVSGVRAGAIVDYEVAIDNKGPDTALDVTMVDTLPAGLEFTEVPVVDGWTCSLNTTNTELTCELPSLEVGVVETIAYKVLVTASTPRGVALVNTATVSFPGVDPTPEDNVDSETISIPIPGPVVNPTPQLPSPTITNPPGVVPDEVLTVVVTPPLAVTGATSTLLVSFASLAFLVGGVFVITARRRREDQE